MKHIHYYIYALLFAASFTACSNDDFSDKLTVSDEVNGPIVFSASAKAAETTRATYEEYDKNRDPSTLGVFGMYNLENATFARFFNNQLVNYTETPSSPWNSAIPWTYTPEKYWADYAWCDRFDFFAYMPYNENASITKAPSADAYTLSIPVEFKDQSDNDAFFITDTKKIPLICKEPNFKTYTGDIIEYAMDQTLTAFKIQFKLGTKMDDVRDFLIKDVQMSGTLAKAGTVSRTYTWDDDKWNTGDISWTVADKQKTAFANVSIPCSTTTPLKINSTNPTDWSSLFYVIPETFTPTITVTYDVTLNDDGVGGEVTRKNVTSTILFSKDLFTNYPNDKGEIAKENTILINIVPSYLYVLADGDQKQGYLFISNTPTP